MGVFSETHWVQDHHNFPRPSHNSLQHLQQVYFILGNRDIMQLRFISELHEVGPPGQEWLPTWDLKAKTFDQFLEEHQDGQMCCLWLQAPFKPNHTSIHILLYCCVLCQFMPVQG